MGNLITASIVERVQALIAELADLAPDDAIEAINAIKLALHEVSPLRDEPVDCVLWVRAEQVEANDYNPNQVAPPEMRLLHISISEDGYTQPIVAWPEGGGYTVVDGFHRHRVGREYADVRKRVLGYLPITVIRTDRTDRPAGPGASIRCRPCRRLC